MNRVDVIVSTYNQPELLRACLHSLQRQAFSDFRLIVADDHSDQPAETLVRAIYPGAVLVRARRNVGLVRCLNAALRFSEAEYVVLLNDDTEPEPQWLGELVKTADECPECGSIASKLLVHGSARLLHSAGDGFAAWGMPVNRGAWLPDLGQYEDETEILSACGGAALYRRSALDKVRLQSGAILDPSLFMYCEDVDIAWRLQLAGYRCRFAPKAVVHHHLSATGGGSLASYYVSRNVLLLLSRTVPREYLHRHGSRVIAYHLGRVFRNLAHIREPAARASLRGTLAGIVLAATDFAGSAAPPATSDYERIEAMLIDRP